MTPSAVSRSRRGAASTPRRRATGTPRSVTRISSPERARLTHSLRWALKLLTVTSIPLAYNTTASICTIRQCFWARAIPQTIPHTYPTVNDSADKEQRKTQKILTKLTFDDPPQQINCHFRRAVWPLSIRIYTRIEAGTRRWRLLLGQRRSRRGHRGRRGCSRSDRAVIKGLQHRLRLLPLPVLRLLSSRPAQGHGLGHRSGTGCHGGGVGRQFVAPGCVEQVRSSL
jgi:hypothetical protein